MKLTDTQRVLGAYTDFHAKHLLRGTPFYKPVGKFFDLDLNSQEVSHPSSKSLYFGRVLLACYENEFIYVPDGPREVDLDIWDANYSEDKLFQSHSIRHTCEGSYFRNLLNEIQVTGDWSVGSFEDYFADYTAKLDAADSKAIVDRIRASKSPKHAARFHAIQLSSEFLIEAEQSEYFKILNGHDAEPAGVLWADEYGYGVHSAKHSTLYMDFLASFSCNDSRIITGGSISRPLFTPRTI